MVSSNNLYFKIPKTIRTQSHGWDDTDQLRYQLGGWYDSISKGPEGALSTFHRFAQFRLSLNAGSYVSSLDTTKSPNEFEKERYVSMRFARLFPGAFVNIEPALVAEWTRTWLATTTKRNSHHAYAPEKALGFDFNIDAQYTYAYSLVQEEGFRLTGKTRGYFLDENFSTKQQAVFKSYLNLSQKFSVYPQHAVLSFSLFGAISPLAGFQEPRSIVRVGGYGNPAALNLPLRGYAGNQFATRKAAVLQTQYVFPIQQIFSGMGTFPWFFKNMGAYVFFDAAKFENLNKVRPDVYTGTGGGLILNNYVFYMQPVQIKLEYAHGMDKTYGGDQILVNFDSTFF